MLQHSGKLQSIVLMAGANSAAKLKRLDDGIFLYNAGKIRALYDLKKYPPSPKSKHHPGQVLTVFHITLGNSIVTALMRKKEQRINAIERIKNWTIDYDKEYFPGWEFESKAFEDDGLKVFGAIKKEYMHKLEILAWGIYKTIPPAKGARKITVMPDDIDIADLMESDKEKVKSKEVAWGTGT